MNLTKDESLQVIELSDEELTDVTGAGGFGACGCGGFGGFVTGPFISTFANQNANTLAYNTAQHFAQSNVNQNSFANIWN